MLAAACSLGVSLPHMSVIDVFCTFSFLFLFGKINEFEPLTLSSQNN